MPYVSEIVDKINAKLLAESFNDKRYTVKLNGLSMPLQRANETVPAVVSQDGVGEFSGFDDRFNVVLYHRCLSTQQVDNPNQFGDSNSLGREQVRCRLIVYAHRASTKENEQSLAFRIARGLSSQFNRSDYSSLSGVMGIVVDAGSSNFDSVNVFTSEYKMPVTAYPVTPDRIYFAMEYIVTIDYNVNCISSCSPC